MARCRVRRVTARLVCVSTAGALAGTMLMLPGIAQTDGEPSSHGGDLSHLIYTARSGLAVRAISPDNGGVVNSEATSFEVATVAGAGVEIAVNGVAVSVKHLGKRAELQDGSLRYTFFGVVLAPGANTITLTPLGADGLRGPSVTETVWGPGPAESIKLTGCPGTRADGRTPCAVRIAVLDHWHHPAAPGQTLKAAIAQGDASISPTGIVGGDVVPDTASAPGPSPVALRTISVVMSAGSSIMLPVIPGVIPGPIHVAAGVGDVSGSVAFDAMPFGRPPIVTGLATVGIGAVPGDPGTDPTIADGTNSRRGRVALYGTGSLSGNAVGSIAYDTAGSLAATSSSGAFLADPDDRPYLTYGDASTRRNDALTQNRLYARVDDAYDSAMWGQFEAATGPAGAAGTVSMLVDGARVVVGSAQTSLSAFTASNQIGYGRELLNVTGLALLETLAHDNLVIGSETVTLVTFDRRTGVIIRQVVLQNLVDYSINYTGGIIRFINVPLPYDTNFNPQQVLVTYEFSATGGSARSTGARFDAPLTRFDGIHVGAGYLNDVTGSGNFTLLAENASGKLPGGSWTISHAGSDGLIPGTADGVTADGSRGSAFRFDGNTVLGATKMTFGYDTTSTGYDNPFGDLAIAGLTDEHFNVTHSFGAHAGDLSLAFDRAQNAAGGTNSAASTQTNLSAILHEKFGPRVTVHAGVTYHESDTNPDGAVGALSDFSTPSPAATPTPAATPSPAPGATPAPAQTVERASVTQADAGIDWKATRVVTLSADRTEDIGGSDATQPAQTTAQVSWALGTSGRIYAKELLLDAPPRTFDTMNDVASATHAFELGIVQKLGANTTVDSTYDLVGTGNATDISSAIGVKEHLAISKLVKGDIFAQRGTGTGTQGADFAVYGFSFGYGDASGRFKATASLQDRTGTNPGATWSLGAAGNIFRDWSLVASDHASRAPGSSTDDARVALAWRPSLSDRGALLAGYERYVGNADIPGSQSGVVAVDGTYRLTRHWQLSGRYARKIDGDSDYVAGTSLVGVGIRDQLNARFDVGAETETVLTKSTTAGNLHAAAVEFGTMVTNTLRAAVGYTFGSTADATLAAAPVRKGFYATLTTTIDRIFGWGAH